MNTDKKERDEKLININFIFRVIILIALVLVMLILCAVRLMKIQIVDGEMYASLSEKSYTAVQTIEAARGQIADSNKTILNTNRIVYKIIVQRAFFPVGRENEIIENTINILKNAGEEWIDTVPITKTTPFKFTSVSDSELDAFKNNINVNPDATAENCLNALYELFNIGDEYSDETKRVIAGIRYQMKIRDFSQQNRYTLAEDISLNTVIVLKEQGLLLPGIDIIEEPMRDYLNTDVLPHYRGTIGAISSDEYAELKDSGYGLNDSIGKSGIESAMESVLRGVNGTRTITRNLSGVAISDEITDTVIPGNSVMLTIDSKFQSDLQLILENHIKWLHGIDETDTPDNYKRGQNTKAGSIAVLEVKTGKVLGLANYPTYDLQDYIDNYSLVLNAEGNPLYPRATHGQYRPGSTFKTITGTSGFLYSTINTDYRFTCVKAYTRFSDHTFYCTGSHGSINIVDALKWSCNSYFYEVGYNVGISRLSDVARSFGVGQSLGLEVGGSTGLLTTRESYERVTGNEFTDGDVVQTAIGQSETLLTPLHLAVQALTLANSGVRYKPYIVDSVWNYDFTEMIYKTEPEVVEIVGDGLDTREYTFNAIKDGMIAVTDNIVWPPQRMDLPHDSYLPDKFAVKTGTPESSDGTYNSTIVAYYPANDPVIAIGVVLEDSEWSRYIIRNIIDAYFYDAYEPDVNEDGHIMTPWKRWSEEKRKKLGVE